jgi:hypothetical protein
MERTRKQKGRGFFKNVLNLFSGRKTVRKKAMRSQRLSNENKEKKKGLEKKWIKSKKNKENLSRLKAKVAPKEEEYQRRLEEGLGKRWAVQKFFNRFYKPQEMPTPKETQIEGLLDIVGNTRKPFNKEKAKVPNRNLNDPPEQISQHVREVNGREIQLAGQATVMYLNAPILFSIWSQGTPTPENVPESLEEIPDAEYDRFANALREATETIDDNNEVVRRIFHMPGGLEELEQWRVEHEEGPGWPNTFVVVDIEYFFGDGSSIETRRVKVRGSASAERMLADFRKTKKMLLESVEADLTTCPSPTDTNNIPARQNASGRMVAPIFIPLTTLKSNGCIQVFKSKEFFEATRDSQALPKSWIILDPAYLTFTQSIPIVAKYFKSARFIQEAFDNWAVEGIDPALFELFQLKYPELAIKCSTYILNTKDFPYKQQKLKPFENFLVVDKEDFQEEIALTIKNPFKESSKFFRILTRAYGMSPYIAFVMKKIARPFYMDLFNTEGVRDTMRIYDGLTRSEQITVDYLQFLRFQDKLLSSEYNFKEARDTYKEFLGQGTLTSGLIRKLIDLYTLHMAKNRDQLEFYQYLVTRPYEKELPVIQISTQEIQTILMKFKRPAPIRRPPNEVEVVENAPLLRVSPPGPLRLRRTVAPVNSSRRSVAPLRSRGEFNAAVENRNQTRRNTTRRVAELNAFLNENRAAFEEVQRRYGGLEGLQPKIDFLTRKLRYLRGNRSRLARNELVVLNQYALAKRFVMAEEDRSRRVATLESL